MTAVCASVQCYSAGSHQAGHPSSGGQGQPVFPTSAVPLRTLPYPIGFRNYVGDSPHAAGGTDPRMAEAIERAIRRVASDTAFICQGGAATIYAPGAP